MLLPSDVARLVLGYLQEEGLSATSQAFIHESPDLKEYAEHSSSDGTIPACVFSIFGKGLTTILNEYVATRTKESCREVPVMMTSLWKKLDFTLNQIKSMQNSPATSACQRTRSRVGVANMARQRVLTVSSASAVVCSTVSESSSVFTPAHTSHVILSHSTPVSYSPQHLRQFPYTGTPQQIQDGSRLQNTPRDSPISIVVSENRINSGPMSPGRRKWDLPRRRGGAQCGSSGPGRSAPASGGISAEPQSEEVVDGNFPQLVIQNARDRILGNRMLQEKLAENINKILANEPTPQTSKASSATVETDPSIDEILGLQGEIHMSDDAIHDILEQTESDPAFQALFDLFDYNKTKYPEGEAGDGDVSSTPEESDGVGSPSTVRLFHSEDPGSSQRDADLCDTNLLTVKMRAGQDRKGRRPGVSTMLKKTLLAPSSKASRIEGSSARLLVTPGEQRGVSSTARGSNNAGVQQMDIDEPLHTPPPPADCMDSSEPPAKDSTTSTSSDLCELVPSSRGSVVTTTSSNVDKTEEQKRRSTEQPNLSSLALSDEPFIVEHSPVSTVDISAIAVSSNGGDAQPVPPLVMAQSASSTSTAASSITPLPVPPDSPASSSASTTPTATMASSTHCSPTSSSCAPAPAPSSSNVSPPNVAAADSSNVVSLKIIISDNQEEESPRDTALNQAISSISGDKIPTIYISSPAKSPGFSGPHNVPGTPKNNLDEVAQAVSGLQSSEVQASPLAAKAGALLASPLTGTSQGPQGYIIQVPLDSSNTALQGAPASYFLVTESPKRDAQPRQVLLPASVPKAQPMSSNQFGAPTSTHPQCFSTGSTLILPSTVKPVVLPFLPASVVGQSSLGNVHMVSNQIVGLASSVSAQQPETVKPKSSSVSNKPSKTAVENTAVGKNVQPASNGKTNQLDATKGSTHRRILCFDSSKAVQAQTPGTTQTTTPAAVQQPAKAKVPPAPRSRAAILCGNKPKRRIETVRCTTDPKAAEVLEKSAGPPQVHKDPVKKNSRKQDHNIQKVCTGQVESSQPPTLKRLESKKRSKSVDRTPSHDEDKAKSADSQTSNRSNDNAQKSGAAVEKEESARKEPAEKAPAKSREGRTEKRTPSQEVPHVTANKENEIKGSAQEQSTSAPSASRDFSPPAVSQPTSNPEPKTPSKTSSLVKQAAEMLQDIQGLSSPPSTVKKPGAGGSDLNLPRTPATSRNLEQPANSPRTPSRHRKCKNGEGTPKRLMPPNTPDIPTCSPASEAGSENSINMAAHTLMILSRAAIARTGTPLKDSLRQDGAEEKTPTSSKSSKKRKLTSPAESPPAKKESKRSPSKKKERERKKLVDCFPHDLDVDKFLSSLHYDE